MELYTNAIRHTFKVMHTYIIVWNDINGTMQMIQQCGNIFRLKKHPSEQSR